jgi:hypothetical protein
MVAQRIPLPIGYHTVPADIQSLDPQEVQPHFLVLDSDDDGDILLPYEYRIDNPRDLSKLRTGVFAVLSEYIASHSIKNLIALEILAESPASTIKMIEFAFDTCTLSLDSRGVPKAKDPKYNTETAWTVEVNGGIAGYSGAETYYGEPGKPHETYKSDSASDVQELINVLRQEGVWDDESLTGS